jgi:hypothetical protein
MGSPMHAREENWYLKVECAIDEISKQFKVNVETVSPNQPAIE